MKEHSQKTNGACSVPSAIDWRLSVDSGLCEQMNLETYSDELVRSSNIYHRLHVNIGFLEQELSYAQDDVNAQAALLETFTKDGEDTFNIDSSGLIREQIDSLKQIQKNEGEILQRLLLDESQLQLTLQDAHPLIAEYPDWINKLFPYVQKKELVDSIISEGGYWVKDNDTIHNCAIPASVHESFLQVWWPIAAQIQEPGYLYKESNGIWIMKGLER